MLAESVRSGWAARADPVLRGGCAKAGFRPGCFERKLDNAKLLRWGHSALHASMSSICRESTLTGRLTHMRMISPSIARLIFHLRQSRRIHRQCLSASASAYGRHLVLAGVPPITGQRLVRASHRQESPGSSNITHARLFSLVPCEIKNPGGGSDRRADGANSRWSQGHTVTQGTRSHACLSQLRSGASVYPKRGR